MVEEDHLELRRTWGYADDLDNLNSGLYKPYLAFIFYSSALGPSSYNLRWLLIEESYYSWILWQTFF